MHRFSLCLFLLGPSLYAACATSTCYPDGAQASGAVYRICMPEPACYNGKLVVFAHGYVAFNEPVQIPEDQLVLPDGTSIPGIVNQLGFGFAVSSYSVNGLAVKQGIADSADLVSIFQGQFGPTQKVYIVGPSEGGLVTALSVEKKPEIYNGGVAACGPIGDFARQLNYIGDFRIIFDYFFPGLLPPSPVSVPPDVINNWETVYVPAVQSAIAANPAATAELLSVTDAPIGSDPATVAQTTVGLLWYHTFGTNDAISKLGGQPFDNSRRLYTGSSNDFDLNRSVPRYTAEAAPLAEIGAHYTSSGALTRPLVTLHTRGDPIIPYWHEPIYLAKALSKGAGRLHLNLPVDRYGHCNFTTEEVLLSFIALLFMDSRQDLSARAAELLPAPRRAAFLKQWEAVKPR